MTAIGAATTLPEGATEGARAQCRRFAAATCLRLGQVAPERPVAYDRSRDPGVRGRPAAGRPSAIERVRARLRQVSPRSRSFLRLAFATTRHGRARFGLTTEEARTVLDEASAARWRATHGLEYRFLVALLQAPGAIPDAMQVLKVSDFTSVPYAAMVGLVKEHGLNALDIPALVADRGFIPPLGPTWWAEEARATLKELLARRERWRLAGLTSSGRAAKGRTNAD